MVNTTQNRERARIRARLGMDADLFEGFTAGLRIATGSDNSPVSTNQTLGGSGGSFSKYGLWLDRAYIKYEPLRSPWGGGLGESSAVTFTAGRFDNPFWSPTELVWDSDLGFDGIAVQARHEIAPGFTPFVVAGAFPIFNTSLDFSTIEPVKFKSEDKYLFGGQLGFVWKAAPLVGFTFAAAIFDFNNVKGRLSSPCDLSSLKDCDTDSLRPSFAQKEIPILIYATSSRMRLIVTARITSFSITDWSATIARQFSPADSISSTSIPFIFRSTANMSGTLPLIAMRWNASP